MLMRRLLQLTALLPWKILISGRRCTSAWTNHGVKKHMEQTIERFSVVSSDGSACSGVKEALGPLNRMSGLRTMDRLESDGDERQGMFTLPPTSVSLTFKTRSIRLFFSPALPLPLPFSCSLSLFHCHSPSFSPLPSRHSPLLLLPLPILPRTTQNDNRSRYTTRTHRKQVALLENWSTPPSVAGTLTLHCSPVFCAAVYSNLHPVPCALSIISNRDSIFLTLPLIRV
ncbi:hypothetical protein EX30DRAFT_261697 [Ascodesmis nigricans]|uniref:Secreted protein n=1 Tax=Ascodesmis nigricans TaxID=341454 RepID=A0A4V3SIT6_9PEZI|nr:hypothetical protein EX30DRAFT_261697 [Ascodesmis nigricans]